MVSRNFVVGVLWLIGLICILFSLQSCGKTNVQNKPITVEGTVTVEHKISLDTDKLLAIYTKKCESQLNALDYPTQAEYNKAVEDCADGLAADFLSIFALVH